MFYAQMLVLSHSGGGVQASRFVCSPVESEAHDWALTTAADGGLWNWYLNREVGPVESPVLVSSVPLADGSYAATAVSFLGWNLRYILSPWVQGDEIATAIDGIPETVTQHKCPSWLGARWYGGIAVLLFDDQSREGGLFYPGDIRHPKVPSRWWTPALQNRTVGGSRCSIRPAKGR